MVHVSLRGPSEGRAQLAKRLKFSYLVAYLFLSLIVLRLWYLQCLNGPYYRDLSENNRIRTLRTEAPRGSFFDREGRLLVGNRPSFNVALMLEDTPDVEQTVENLSTILELEEEEIKARLKSRKSRPFEPQVIVRDVSREQLARVKVNQYRLPGVIVNTTPARTYPFESLGMQLFGYAREISREELNKRSKDYRRGDIIGKTGLERSRAVSYTHLTLPTICSV